MIWKVQSKSENLQPSASGCMKISRTWEELDKFKCLEAKCREKPWKVRARTYGTKSPSRSEALRFIDSAKSPSTKIDGSLVNFRRRLSNRHGRPLQSFRWASVQAKLHPDWGPDLCESRRRAHSPIGVLRMSIVNILRGLPCRLESLRLKFTNEPSIFVDGDLAESIKRSASDRLGDLVP